LLTSEALVLLNIATDTDPFLTAWTIYNALIAGHLVWIPILIHDLPVCAIRGWALPKPKLTAICLAEVNLLNCGQLRRQLIAKHAANKPARHNTGTCCWTQWTSAWFLLLYLP
jgi:hypothetical protein